VAKKTNFILSQGSSEHRPYSYVTQGELSFHIYVSFHFGFTEDVRQKIIKQRDGEGRGWACRSGRAHVELAHEEL